MNNKNVVFGASILIILIASIWIYGNIASAGEKEFQRSVPFQAERSSVSIDSSVAGQLSLAFESAAEMVSASVVPIFAEEEQIPST